MREFILYGVPQSPYVRAVAIGFEEKRANYSLVALGPGGSKTPEYLKLHAFGRIPALRHGAFELYETQAILRYLDREIPGPSLTPLASQDEARMNQFCGITDCYVVPDMTMGIAFARLVAPFIGMSVDEADIAASIPRAKICVSEIARLLGGRPFLAGDTVSVADILLGAHLSFCAGAPECAELLKPHRNLLAWIDRMDARPSFRNTTPDLLVLRTKAA